MLRDFLLLSEKKGFFAMRGELFCLLEKDWGKLFLFYQRCCTKGALAICEAPQILLGMELRFFQNQAIGDNVLRHLTLLNEVQFLLY